MKKLPALEGLRGIAAVVVVIYHLRLTFFAESSQNIRSFLGCMPPIPANFFRAFFEGLYNGTFAVWLFWIMSGFVLSFQFFKRVLLIPPTAAHDYLEEALLRRYPRLLLPVFTSVVVAYLLCHFHLMRNVDFAHALANPAAGKWIRLFYNFHESAFGAFKSATWNCFFSYDAAPSYNCVLWTMEPEFFGSLFLFSFLALLGHRSSRFIAYPLAAIACTLLQLYWLIAFLGGIALCDLFVNRDNLFLIQKNRCWTVFKNACNNTGINVVFWLLVIAGAGFPNYRGVSYILLGLLAVQMTLLSRPTQHLLSSPVPMFLGRISFGIYLIHFPIICSFSCAAYLALFKSFGHTITALLVSVMTLGMSVVAGYLLYLVADKPAIRWSRHLALLVMNRIPKPHL
jgi:peptidoglycan/LPS O-acetylase OafA/YrhL